MSGLARTGARLSGAVGMLIALSACTATTADPAAETTAASSAPAPPADDEPAATDPPRPSTPDVVLSRAAWNPDTAALEAGGYLSPLVEDGGSCTLRLSRNGVTVTADVPGLPDATTTICGGLGVPGTELSPGEWTAVLHYRSAGVDVSSAPLRVAVPR